MTSEGPCTLNLTEERQTLRTNNSPDAPPPVPVRQVTHYSIPAADLRFGLFATHHVFERGGIMRVIMFARRATIRRWHGNSLTAPPDAEVVFVAPINFGKLDIDIFDVPLRFQNALQYLTCLCQGITPPDTDPFRP